MPKRSPLCIYRHPSADGFMAACVVDRFFGRGVAEFMPAALGDRPPPRTVVANRDVYVVGLSYPETALREIAAAANRVLALDRRPAETGGPCGVRPPAVREGPLRPCERPYIWPFAEADMPQPIDREPRAVFDEVRSGAGLTWEFFFPGKPAPCAVALVEDDALWKFDMPGSREFAARLFAEPYSPLTWKKTMNDFGMADF